MAGCVARGTIARTAGFITTLYVRAPQTICFIEKPLVNCGKLPTTPGLQMMINHYNL